jgi:Uncharacterised nucleotidyltransferase
VPVHIETRRLLVCSPKIQKVSRSSRQNRAERRAILLSASTSARRAEYAEQASRWLHDIDWERLAANLRARKLLPVLGPRIIDLANGAADHGFIATVDTATDAARRHGTFLQLVSERVISALSSAGVGSVALKGPALGETIYGDPGLRLSSDVDLLVDPKHLEAAVALVRGLGYSAPTDRLQPNGLPLLHYSLAHEQGELPPVEIHWRIHWYEGSFATERLLPRADLSLSPDVWRPAPPDELAALLLFYARDGFVDLRLACDVGAWWDMFGDSFPDEGLNEVISTYPQLARPIHTAAYVADRVVGLPRARILEVQEKRGLREVMAARLADPNPTASRGQLYADIGFIDGLLMPSREFTSFIRRQVLPPQEVLDEYARYAPQWGARSRADYSLRVCVRLGFAALKTLNSAEGFNLNRND